REVKPEEVDAAIKLARGRGYCFMNRWKIGSDKERELYSKDGAIAIPLMNDGLAFGSLATRFINAAVKAQEIERSILPQMREVAGLIEAEWKQFRTNLNASPSAA
ncbi:MAG: hypothetical protein KDE14_04600, partial [Rhodobacteraceae bacterium]|nr:hypothetical protein [Paracoccaceae bacterium]